MRRSPRTVTRPAFTLTELMVAVLVLIVVIVATSKIFGTASKVTGLGQAGADVLQEAAAIERQIRADIERLSREGFFAIRCVAVPNNVNAPGPLLNPALPPGHAIRADQLVFFTQGVQSIQTFRSGSGLNRRGQSTAARVYYGHAFQVPNAPAVEIPGDPAATFVRAIDPRYDASNPMVPWFVGPRNFDKATYSTIAANDYALAGTFGSVDATQPPAPQWLVARQALVLANDDAPDIGLNSPSQFLLPGGGRAGRSIFVNPAPGFETPEVINGRVDAAASELNDIRVTVLDYNADGVLDPWTPLAGSTFQQNTIAGAVMYPRAERIAPGMHRVDQSLTNHVISSACSSFVVDWTYDDGIGEILDDAGAVRFVGVVAHSNWEQPWFGLDLAGDVDATRGVRLFSDYITQVVGIDPHAIFPENIEQFDATLNSATGLNLENAGAVVYEAIFGYNQDRPLNAAGFPWPIGGGVAYTPWPSAIRITMTLHDPELKLEAGRQVQFVIELPRQSK